MSSLAKPLFGLAVIMFAGAMLALTAVRWFSGGMAIGELIVACLLVNALLLLVRLAFPEYDR